MESPRLSGKGGVSLVKRHENIQIAGVDSIDDGLEDLLRRVCRHIDLPGGGLVRNVTEAGFGRSAPRR